MDKLFKKYPFRSERKFIPIAIENGFTKQEAKEFLSTLSHDVKFNPREYYLPIYSEYRDAYQFDTLVQTAGASPRYFLVFININSRKLYVYPMKDKGTKQVLSTLERFYQEVGKISNLTSDQDKAYLSDGVLMFMKEHNIDYRTTAEHDHNRLGIINRVIRTLRDMNHDRDFTIESMNRCVEGYNNSIHSSTGKKPNSFNSKDEERYINKMRLVTDERRSVLKPGTHVRTVVPKGFEKRRSAISEDAYVVDSIQGNKYMIRAKDNSIALYPRHKLVVSNRKIKIGDTLDDDKRGVVEKIIDFRKGKYSVVYEGGVKDKISPSALREERPTRLSLLEREYWKDKPLPGEIRKYS